MRKLEELKTIESIMGAFNTIHIGKDLPSSRAGDFMQVDGEEVTDADLFEDV